MQQKKLNQTLKTFYHSDLEEVVVSCSGWRQGERLVTRRMEARGPFEQTWQSSRFLSCHKS